MNVSCGSSHGRPFITLALHNERFTPTVPAKAYLTFVASGQITCQEDGGHHRPCAAANAAKAVTEALWDISHAGRLPWDAGENGEFCCSFQCQGDAELFIARRIFPCLPSFSDEFTCAVPMTRIRDIAHRGDIPHDMKQHLRFIFRIFHIGAPQLCADCLRDYAIVHSNEFLQARIMAPSFALSKLMDLGYIII